MKKNDSITLALEALWKSTSENKKKSKEEGRGAPISAVIFNEMTGEVLCAFTNDRAKTKTKDPKTHAEKKCLKAYSSQPGDEIVMLVTLNPCTSCLWSIKKDNKIKKVYYLIDSSNPKLDSDKKVWITKFTSKTIKQENIINKVIKNHKEFLEYKRENPTDKDGNNI